MAYRAGADISHFAAFNDVVESAHDLLARRVAVQPVNLQHVDISAEPLDTGVDCVEDVLARQAHTVDKGAVVARRRRNRRLAAAVVDAEEALGQDDDAAARNVVLLQCLADDLLRAAVRVDVGLSSSAMKSREASSRCGIDLRRTVSHVLMPRL